MEVVYLRTSTDKQKPENQKKDCLSLCPKPDHIIVEKQSAWKDSLKNRPKFKKIYEKMKKRKIKKIVVWDWDRLFRNRKMFYQFMVEAQTYGCQIISYRQQWFNDLFKGFREIPEPWGNMIEGMFRPFLIKLFGHLAEMESRKKSDRIKAAYRNSDKKDKWGRPEKKINLGRVRNLRDSGKSWSEISEIMGIPKSTVYTKYQKYCSEFS